MQSTVGSTHLVLRPGVPVLARSPGTLQVGLDGPTARLPDQPTVRRLLRTLRRPGGIPPEAEDAAATEALDVLQEAGLLVPVPGAAGVADPRLVTLRAQFGPDAGRRQAGRAAATLAVRADPVDRATLDPILAAAGLQTAADPGEAAAHLVVVTGQVARESVDSLVRGSVPHLLVSGDATRRRVGPFVDPGRTACLRCVDAHESLSDPRRPLLLAQAAAEAVNDPPPRDPVLDRMALAWAARDLSRYLEGDEPSTWSTTVDIGPTAAPEVTRWGRHPYCGCAWDAILELP